MWKRKTTGWKCYFKSSKQHNYFYLIYMTLCCTFAVSSSYFTCFIKVGLFIINVLLWWWHWFCVKLAQVPLKRRAVFVTLRYYTRCSQTVHLHKVTKQLLCIHYGNRLRPKRKAKREKQEFLSDKFMYVPLRFIPFAKHFATESVEWIHPWKRCLGRSQPVTLTSSIPLQTPWLVCT